MSTNETLARGRAAFARDAWSEAYRALLDADREAPLDPEDLDRLATVAYLIGQDAISAEVRARAHAGFLEGGEPVRAARSAFWLAMIFFDKAAQRAQAGGWLARARRLLDECGQDCVEHGFLLCTSGVQRILEGDLPSALTAFEQAAETGARFRDRDVTTLARHGLARTLIRMNRQTEGFALLDEVMVSVTSGEVSPLIAGIVYCSVISACYDVFDMPRAHEWTIALTAWCEAHPDMAPFRGTCLVRRSELMQLHGAWTDAAEEAQRASEWLAQRTDEPEAGAAFYQQGELYRVRGDLVRAEDAYRRASLAGRKPDPGLLLVRLAQGQTEAAVAAVRRLLQETRDARARARMLPAAVEVLLAARDVPSAAGAAEELAQLSRQFGALVLHASSASASGAVALASGEHSQALDHLREAWDRWKQLDAPYEIARIRVSVGLAYRALGDEEGAQLEFDAAQEVFDRLGATLDATRVASLSAPVPAVQSGALTGREVEVLRLVATGKSNKAIAAELAISEKTVARHLANIFTKLDLPSRAAATAYAYEHKLV